MAVLSRPATAAAIKNNAEEIRNVKTTPLYVQVRLEIMDKNQRSGSYVNIVSRTNTCVCVCARVCIHRLEWAYIVPRFVLIEVQVPRDSAR